MKTLRMRPLNEIMKDLFYEITFGEAVTYFEDESAEVLRLYDDGTEGVAESYKGLAQHYHSHGRFGISWEEAFSILYDSCEDYENQLHLLELLGTNQQLTDQQFYSQLCHQLNYSSRTASILLHNRETNENPDLRTIDITMGEKTLFKAISALDAAIEDVKSRFAGSSDEDHRQQYKNDFQGLIKLQEEIDQQIKTAPVRKEAERFIF